MENFIRLIEQQFESLSEKKLKKNLQFIQEVLNLLFSYISKTDDLDEAALAFKLLENIQFVLARASFKEGVVITSLLKKFVSDFDRIDDEEMKAYLYLKIKSGEYLS